MATKFKRHRFPKDDGFDWRSALRTAGAMIAAVLVMLLVLHCLFSMKVM